MTILVSVASERLIAMTVDSVETRRFADHHCEYVPVRKSWFFDGVGCVGTWGAREANQVERSLIDEGLSSATHSINDLADLVACYLKDEYRPHEMGLDDVGYHVAGFDRDGNPRLYHIFWGFDRPRPPSQKCRHYKRCDHSPQKGLLSSLYNGRNDLAQPVVKVLIDQLKARRDIGHDINTGEGLAWFADFVARFAGEITPEVGPPFITHLIWPDMVAVVLKNKRFEPLDPNAVSKEICRARGHCKHQASRYALPFPH